MNKKIMFLVVFLLMIGCANKNKSDYTYEKYSKRLIDEMQSNQGNLEIVIKHNSKSLQKIKNFLQKDNIYIQNYTEKEIYLSMPIDYLKDDFFIKNKSIIYIDLQNNFFEKKEDIIEDELNFLSNFIKNNPNKNIAFSPYSLQQMSQTLALANHELKNETIKKISTSAKVANIEVFNSIWHQQELNIDDEFLKNYQTYLNGYLFPIDFNQPTQAVNLINLRFSDEVQQRLI